MAAVTGGTERSDTLKVETTSGLGYFRPEVCTSLRKTIPGFNHDRG